MFCRVIIAVSCFLCLTFALCFAQGDVMTKEQMLNQLKLQEARLALKQAEREWESYTEEYESTKELFEEDVITLMEFNQVQKGYDQARLNYQQAKLYLERTELEFLKTATNISIIEARKYKTETGKRMVEITLQNTSNVSQAMASSENLSEEDMAALLRIQNIRVSIREGSIVGEPYEIVVPSLELGQKETLKFRLLKDSEKVDVVMKFLETERTISVVLKKESLQDVPTINSTQFSQEGDLNSEVRYGIVLERLAEDERSFNLVVLNLPQQIDFSFIDPSTNAKLAQVRFTEKISKIFLDLKLTIPENLRRELIDRTAVFYVVVTETSELARINALKDKYGEEPIPPDEIKKIKGDKVKLELIPRGIGELEVVISNRYQEIQTGQTDVTIRVDIHNKGTLAVQNVKAVADLPYEWESEVDPLLIKEVEAGEKAPVKIKVMPPLDLSMGEYDVQVEAQGEVGNEKVESIEKNITIRVGAKTNILGNALLITALIALVFGMVVASIKISKR